MTMIYTVTGTIGLVAGDPTINGALVGIDGGGYFGPAGGSIVGMPYTVTWIANDCECTGGAPWSVQPNPVIDVTLTIGGHSYDFGGGGWYGEFYLNNCPVNYLPSGCMNIQQTAYNGGGSMISTSINFASTLGVGGEFEIVNPVLFAKQGGIFTNQLTTGYFLNPVPVPGPIVGGGLPGLVLLCVVGFKWLMKRKMP